MERPREPSFETLEAQFCVSAGSPFARRFGPAGKTGRYSNKKVCFAATDRAFLVRTLHALSLREDCYMVKYALHARDGMFLGRCFLRTDEAAATLCQSLKADPKLLVTLQDDEFFNRFRER